MFASIGLTPEPCGLPEYVSWYVHCSIYPALKNFHISDINASSFMRFLKSCIVIWWSKLIKTSLNVSFDYPLCTSEQRYDFF